MSEKKEINVSGISTGIVAALLIFMIFYSTKVDCGIGVKSACDKIEASYHMEEVQ